MDLPFFVIALVLLFAKCSDCQDRTKYFVPEPNIEVFAKGFRVSIPDQDGINLFAFHGNINIPLNDLEAGQYSRDILKKEDGLWVFENTAAKLNVGDVIYYWMFVIRFNLGYRYDNGKFIVKDITEYKPPAIIQSGVSSAASDINTNKSNWFFEPLDEPNFRPSIHKSSPAQKPQNISPSPTTSNQHKVESVLTAKHKPVSTCCQLFLNLTNQISLMSEQIDTLMEENKILSEIAERDDHYATSLKVFGKYSSEYYPTPKDFAQNLISEKLKLVGIKVVEAKKIPDNGISFKVETVRDKLKIILAQAKLEGSNYDLSW